MKKRQSFFFQKKFEAFAFRAIFVFFAALAFEKNANCQTVISLDPKIVSNDQSHFYWSGDEHSEVAASSFNDTDSVPFVLSSGTDYVQLSGAKGPSYKSRYAYSNFSVPISVPAYTKRTFALQFEVYLYKNSGSEAGFFTELIEGEVSGNYQLNTEKTSSMKGNTKARVYYSGGTNKKEEKQLITLEYTVDNLDSSEEKNESKKFAIFGGYSKVQLFTPTVEHKVTLTGFSYDLKNDVYAILYETEKCEKTAGPSQIKYANAVSATFSPNSHYEFSEDSVKVYRKGALLSSADYAWDASAKSLSILGPRITGCIKIEISASPCVYAVTLKGNLLSHNGTQGDESKTYTYSEGLALTNFGWEKAGHTFLGWHSDAALTQRVSQISSSDYGDKTLYAKWSDHVFSTQKSDSENHWMECECSEKYAVTAHDFSVPKTSESGHWMECVCGKKSGEAPHDFGTVWLFSESGHWKKCVCGKKSGEGPHAYGEWTLSPAGTILPNHEHEISRKCGTCDFVERAARHRH